MSSTNSKTFDLNDNKEFVTLRHTLSLIGKRVVPCSLFSEHPLDFMKWQYNCCRQVAMVVAWFLKKSFKDRSISLYEANFKDPYLGDAVHAFVYMKPREGDKFGLLVDVSRVSYPVLVERMPELRDPAVILSNKMGYEITMENLTEVKWEELLKSEEYFTKIPYQDFCHGMTHLLELSLQPKN